MPTLTYPYRPSPWKMALGALFFAACAAGMAHEAMTNDRGLILNGVIELSTRGATNFYWSMAAASGVFVALGGAGAIAGLVGTQELTLTATELSVPRTGFSRRPTVVALGDVVGLELQEVQGQRFLTVRHRAGKLAINRSFLPNPAAFDAVCEALASRLPRA